MMSRPVKWGELQLPIRRDTVIPTTVKRYRRPLRACDLPSIMDEVDWFDAYRYALVQFVADWNHSDNPAGLVIDPPTYDGDDQRLLPTVASVVHALADRQGIAVPSWVFDHRAAQEWVVFADPPGSYFWERDRIRAPSTCEHHRVFFHPRLLDKGTADWWLPWD